MQFRVTRRRQPESSPSGRETRASAAYHAAEKKAMQVSDAVKALLDKINSSERTLIFEQEAEIVRLRLTTAEREAVEWAANMIDDLNRGDPERAATIRSFLSRVRTESA